jgi:quercetin dioxygenase-like cupin family protein
MAILLALLLIYGGAAAAQVQPPATAPPAQAPTEDPAYKLLVENPSVRAFQIALGPGESTRVHEHQRDLMVIAAGAAQFTLLGPKTERMQMAGGEVQVLTGARRHSVRNDARQPLRLTVIELGKPFDPARAVCGLGERACGGEMGGSLTQGAFVYSAMFETDNFHVVDVTLDPRAVAERFPLKGEHLVVPVTALELRKDGEPITYAPGQAFWAAEGFTQGLENAGKEPARWVAVEVR